METSGTLHRQVSMLKTIKILKELINNKFCVYTESCCCIKIKFSQIRLKTKKFYHHPILTNPVFEFNHTATIVNWFFWILQQYIQYSLTKTISNILRFSSSGYAFGMFQFAKILGNRCCHKWSQLYKVNYILFPLEKCVAFTIFGWLESSILRFLSEAHL